MVLGLKPHINSLSICCRDVGIFCCRLTMLLSKSYDSVRPLLQCKHANRWLANRQSSTHFLKNQRYRIGCATVEKTYVVPDIWCSVVASARFSSLSQETFEQASRSHPAPHGSHDGSINDDIRKARRVNSHGCRRFGAPEGATVYILSQYTKAK